MRVRAAQGASLANPLRSSRRLPPRSVCEPAPSASPTGQLFSRACAPPPHYASPSCLPARARLLRPHARTVASRSSPLPPRARHPRLPALSRQQDRFSRAPPLPLRPCHRQTTGPTRSRPPIPKSAAPPPRFLCPRALSSSLAGLLVARTGRHARNRRRTRTAICRRYLFMRACAFFHPRKGAVGRRCRTAGPESTLDCSAPARARAARERVGRGRFLEKKVVGRGPSAHQRSMY